MAHVSSSNSDWRRVSKHSLTIDHIDLITPWSTFAVILTSCRLSIRVKRLWRYCTGRTPAAMLNCKHAVSRSHCSCGTLFNRVFSTQIRSIQNRVLSFQGVDCTMCGVLVASNGFISLISKDRLKASWAMKTNEFSKNFLGTFEGCRNGYGQAYFEFYGNRNLIAIFFKICTFLIKRINFKFTCWIVVLYRGFFLSQIYIWSLLTNSRKRGRESRNKKKLEYPRKAFRGTGEDRQETQPTTFRIYDDISSDASKRRKKTRRLATGGMWCLIMRGVHRNTSCLTSDYINVIGPWSTLAIRSTSCRFSILVKGLWCCSTGRTPATMLNCEHAVTCSYCSHCALLNGVFSSPICPIQNRILSFQG